MDLYERFKDLDPLNQSQWSITWGKRSIYFDWARDDTHAGIVVSIDDEADHVTEDIFSESVPLAEAVQTATDAVEAGFAWLRETTGRSSKNGVMRARAFIRNIRENCEAEGAG